MRDSTLYAWAISTLLISSASAIDLVDRAGEGPAVLAFDIQRSPNWDQVAPREPLRRRATTGPANVVLDNRRNLYFANASLGTPPQQIRFHLDTGSSDLWTNVATSSLCRESDDPCGESGTYNANKSSTYDYVSSNFKIAYVDESGARGDYATDTLRLGDVEIPKLQFGIGYRSTSGESILGLGYPSNEAQAGLNGGRQYRNLLQMMTENKVIKSNAFSLWLNDLDAASGSVLFGGVNTEKYVGQLSTLPVQNTTGSSGPTEFIITLTELSFAQPKQKDRIIATNLAIPVLLDSGATVTFLPDNLAHSILRGVNAEYSSDAGVALVPCSLADNTTSLNFKFTSPVISVPLNELVIPPKGRGRLLLSDGRTAACEFGISPAGSSTFVLGDTFLRSAYVVYDLDNDEISIAQTDFNSTRDNVREIGTGRSSVPDTKPVANPVPAVASQSGGRLNGPRPSPTSTGPAPTKTKTGDAAASRSAFPTSTYYYLLFSGLLLTWTLSSFG